MKNPGFKFEYFTKTINYKGKCIETYVIGSGDKTVLSFPSYPHSGISYLWFLNHYSLEKVRFITFDLPGWIGDSENIFRNQVFDIEEFIRIAKEVLKAHDVTKFNILGYSFGGALAIKLANEMPDRVKKVVLVSPVIDGNASKFTKEVIEVNLVKLLHIPYAMKLHIQNRWKKLAPLLLAENCPPTFISIYGQMVQMVDQDVLLNSIYTLFHLNWCSYLTCLENKECLIVNSRTETKLFRKQAELLRRKLSNKNSLYLTGQHEDFLLNPKSEVVRQVVQFLISD